MITDDPPVQYLRTLTEVRAELAYYAGHDELLTQFKYVHPDLEGDPIPDVREGGTVMVSVKDPDDPRSALNGALGQVVAEYRLTCQVSSSATTSLSRSFIRSTSFQLMPLKRRTNEWDGHPLCGCPFAVRGTPRYRVVGNQYSLIGGIDCLVDNLYRLCDQFFYPALLSLPRRFFTHQRQVLFLVLRLSPLLPPSTCCSPIPHLRLPVR